MYFAENETQPVISSQEIGTLNPHPRTFRQFRDKFLE